MNRTPRLPLLLAAASPLVLLACLSGPARSGPGLSANYPPAHASPPVPAPKRVPGNAVESLLFTNTHSYEFDGDPQAVVIRVDLYDNYLGDFSKYFWVYTVRNNSYEPAPGESNGFSGFELTLPQNVPDIGDIGAPDGIPPWLINCCSGLPVEWDLPNSAGAGGGTLIGQTEVYSFTTLPRLISASTGWFHTWQFDSQAFIVAYPPDNRLEVPYVLSPPGQELCCHRDSTGALPCEILPAGQCASVGGEVVATCDPCVSRNHPPDCAHAVASDPVLWPPNRTYHAISILGVTDPDSDPVTITVTSITQDEPVNTRGDGNTCPDAQIVEGQASVRAERTGTPGIPGNGRIYTINFTASDGNGGACPGSVTVCVPHDQSDPTCVDDGQRYNSLGRCQGGNQLGVEQASLAIVDVSTGQAQVTFALPVDGPVEIAAFDVAGRRLATIVSEVLPSGVYERDWNMGGIPKGLYFVRIQAGEVKLTRTVIKLD